MSLGSAALPDRSQAAYRAGSGALAVMNSEVTHRRGASDRCGDDKEGYPISLEARRSLTNR